MTTTTAVHYLAPTRADLVTARAIRRLTRMGFSLWGSRELTVVGRRSGEPRTTAVNLLEVDGQRFLVAPRGTTDWVRNLRAAGEGDLRVGRRVEQFQAIEVADGDKTAILRAYLERWAFEVGRFFEDVDATSSDAALAAVAHDHPVFQVISRSAPAPTAAATR